MRLAEFSPFLLAILAVLGSGPSPDAAAEEVRDPSYVRALEKVMSRNEELEVRIETALELFGMGDLVVAEELFDLALDLDSSSDHASSSVSSRIFQEYWRFYVELASSRDEKIALLLAAMESQPERKYSWTRTWAALELCDFGLSFAWAEIEDELETRSSWGREHLAACQRKIDLVERCNGDYVKAWEVALRTEDPLPMNPVHWWARSGLGESKSREAGAVLLRFYVPQLPSSWWDLVYITRDLRRNGWTEDDLREFGWTGEACPQCR